MTTPPPNVLDGQHRLDTNGAGTSEPVRIAHIVTTALYLAVTLGWVFLPNTVIDTIGTVVAFLLSTYGAELARGKVSPTGRITWDGIKGVIRAMVYEEIDRLAAAAPALTVHSSVLQAAADFEDEQNAQQQAAAPSPPPAPEPSATQTAELPVQPPPQ